MTAKLTRKQQAFAENKAAGMTNRDAAIAAGYAVAAAGPTAYKLMQHPGVRATVKAATKGAGVDIAAGGKPTMPRAKYADSMTFLVDVMNHAQLPIAMRADAAKQLLPYQHARMGEQGKKEKAKDRAKELAGNARNKFSPKGAPPMRIITGGKDT